MSTQRGNVHRHRPQKHKNQTAFKNTLHSNERTKFINSLRAEGCCARCKDIIEWKIKYKKYKPLTQPKKCIKCNQKAVKRAYFIVCPPCAEKHKVCVKCGKEEEIVVQIGMTEEEFLKNQAQLEQELKYLPERKRRAFHRLQASGKLTGDVSQDGAATCRSKSKEDSDNQVMSSSEDEENDNSSSEVAEDQAESITDNRLNGVHFSMAGELQSDCEMKTSHNKGKESEFTEVQNNIQKLDI